MLVLYGGCPMLEIYDAVNSAARVPFSCVMVETTGFADVVGLRVFAPKDVSD